MIARTLPWVACALLWLVGCAGGNGPEAAPSDPSPGAAAARFEAAGRYSADHAGHTLLVMEGESVVYEVGHNGHDPRRAYALHGATESFWGVLALAAEADGLISLDETVSSSVEGFAADPRKREVRIRHLLHYTSGLEAGFQVLGPADGDRFARALTLQAVTPPGQRFQYGPSHLFVLGEVLRRKLSASGRESDPLSYLESRIFDPIGLEVAEWQRDAAGRPDVAGGAVLAARQWAKFGRLLARGGRWQSTQVVDPDALAACFRGSEANLRYGCAIWLNAPAQGRGSRRDLTQPFYPDGLSDLVLASGLHNQRLYVIPSLDLVVVRFAGRDRNFRDAEFLARLVAPSSAGPRGG